MRNLVPAAVACGLALALATACGAPPVQGGGDPASRITVDSCGRPVVFDRPPERVLAIGSEAPSLLVAAGAGDRVTHYAGSLAVPFEPEARAVVERAQRVSEDSHELSFETIVNSGVDVAIGTDVGAGVDLDGLADRLNQAGIQLLTVSGYCQGIDGRSTNGVSGFDLIYRDLETYGRIFGTPQAASGAVEALRARVTAASTRARGGPERRGAPLYVRPSGPLGAYGGQSLVSEQMALVGVDNVFRGVPSRFFEPSAEQLVDGAPGVVLAMYLPTGSSGLETPEAVTAAVRGRPELAGVPAVADGGSVLPLNYYFTSAGPLAVTGLELMADRLAAP